jgi:hypothetical protein
MLMLLTQWHLTLQLILLDVLPPSPGATTDAVYPQGANGIAASLIGGFFGIGVLIVVAILMGTKPRRRRSTSDERTQND